MIAHEPTVIREILLRFLKFSFKRADVFDGTGEILWCLLLLCRSILVLRF